MGADIVVPFLLVAIVFGGMLWHKYREASRLPDLPPGKQNAAVVQKVVLMFSNLQGQLVREARDVEKCDDRTACLRTLMEELFRGPVNDLEDLYPEWSTINSVSIEGSTAIIDLGQDFVDGLAPGSSTEILAVYGIVNTVCVNMPEIKSVRITIDGNRQSRLRHLDLSSPVMPNPDIEAPVPKQGKEGN